MQGAEITEPRGTNGEAGQDQENVAARTNLWQAAEFTPRPDDSKNGRQHHESADQGGEVGIDVLDADLGKNRGKRCKDRGKSSPEGP